MTGRWSTAGLRVAVTGASGFLGRQVIGALVASGACPVVVSGDVRQPLDVNGQVDVVCHLAGKVGARFTRDPGDGLQVNVSGTLHALELCRRLRCRLVIASSCAVYSPHRGAVHEDDPRGPADDYGFSKLLAEILSAQYAEYQDINVTLLRLFNPYGPGQSPEFLIPYLCRTINESRCLSLQHPRSVRDFIHIQDVAEVVRRACCLDGRLTVLNVGSGIPRTVVEVAATIAELAGGPLQWEPAPETLDPFGQMWADVERMRAVLGWSPAISIEQGLGMTFQAEAECDSGLRSGCRRR